MLRPLPETSAPSLLGAQKPGVKAKTDCMPCQVPGTSQMEVRWRQFRNHISFGKVLWFRISYKGSRLSETSVPGLFLHRILLHRLPLMERAFILFRDLSMGRRGNMHIPFALLPRNSNDTRHDQHTHTCTNRTKHTQPNRKQLPQQQ